MPVSNNKASVAPLKSATTNTALQAASQAVVTLPTNGDVTSTIASRTKPVSKASEAPRTSTDVYKATMSSTSLSTSQSHGALPTAFYRNQNAYSRGFQFNGNLGDVQMSSDFEGQTAGGDSKQFNGHADTSTSKNITDMMNQKPREAGEPSK